MKSLSTGARVFITLLIFTILFFIGCYLMEMSIDDDSNNHINRMPEYDEVIMAEIDNRIDYSYLTEEHGKDVFIHNNGYEIKAQNYNIIKGDTTLVGLYVYKDRPGSTMMINCNEIPIDMNELHADLEELYFAGEND